MIQANELRLGNWVSFKGMWNGQVDKLTKFSVELKDNDNLYPVDCFEGIKLTTERLGGCDINLLNWFCEGGYKILEDTADLDYGWTFKVRNASHTTEIEFGYFKYVHQLQNMYFLLTGEELPIQINKK